MFLFSFKMVGCTCSTKKKQREKARKEDMDVKVKELVVYIRIYLLFSLKYTYRFACKHPFVASFALSLFLLYSWCPSLFAFLVSSSPVLSCTALLLGILLSYGEPNIPEFDEDDKINQDASSLKVEVPVDDLFHKKDKDESYTLEDIVDSRVGTEEWAFNDLVSDGVKERESVLLALSSLVEEEKLESGFVENLEVLMKEQTESHVRMSKVTDGPSEGIEALMVKINKPELDDWLDSSLGSPWQPINIHDSTSDSESDRAESSSSDASMTDILPMLDELHPLLESEAPHHARKSADNLDLELSQHHKSDEDSVVQEDEHKIEEKDESNRVVTWTADDQKNVMDLGSSDLERNRRLESLIARRRARKNQIIIFEKDLIDLHSNVTTMDELFHFNPRIPPISAPRSNPFDLPKDSDESKGLPPIPGSAPSVLLHRKNPFDFSCDSEDGNKGLAGERLCQLEFGLPYQSGYFFRRRESFASHSLFPSNLMHEKHGSSRLNPYFVAERMDSEGNDYVDFHRQLTGPALDTISSAIDSEGQKVLTEQEMQECIALSAPDHDAKPSEQCRQSYEDDLVDFQPELGEDCHSVDPNASAVTEEIYRCIDTSSIDKKAVEEIEFGSSMLDGQKHDDLIVFSSSEKNEKTLDICLPDVLETQEQITSVSKGSSESMQSSDAYASHLIFETEGVGNNQAAVPIYDSSPSGSGNFIAGISVPNDILLSSGRGGLYSASSVESHMNEDAMEVLSQEKALEESMTSEVIEFEMVHGSKLHDSTSSSVRFSTCMNLLDENILASKGVSETREHDLNENRTLGLDKNTGYLATSLKIDHPSSLSSAMADNEPSFEISVALLPSEVEGKHRSMEKLEMQKSFGTYLEESRLSNLELGPILEDNSEDFKVEEEHVNPVQATTTFSSNALQIVEELNVGLSSVGQDVVPLNYQSEKAGDEGNEEGLAFLSEKATHSKTFNLVSANDDMMDSMEFSNQSKLKSEQQFTSNYDSRDSQDSIINELQLNQDVIFRCLNDFHSEPGDVDAEVREIQVIDEHFLSELDAVGDFQVEELKPQKSLYMGSQSASQFDCSVEDSELISADISEMSPKKPISANLDVLDEEESIGSAYWSLPMAHVDDLEMTVYNPKPSVLRACSLEELESIFKQDTPAELAEPPLSETISEKLVEEKPHVSFSRLDMVDQENMLLKWIDESDSELLVLEAKSIEDIHSAFKLVTEIVVNKSISTVNPEAIIAHPVDNVAEAMSPEVEKFSSFQVLEAKSAEDISSAFNQATEKDLATPIFHFSDPVSTRTQPNFQDMEPSSPDIENLSELFVLEARSVEDIQLAFKQATEENSAIRASPLIDPESRKTNQDLDVVDTVHLEAQNNAELLVPEGKIFKDIDSSFEQADEDLDKPKSLFDSEKTMTHSVQELEAAETGPLKSENDTEILVLEKKIVGDVTSAFEQAADQADDKTVWHQVYPVLLGTRVNNEAVDVKSLERQNVPELLFINAKSAVDIDSTFKPSSEGGLLRSTLLEIDPDHDAVKDWSLQANTNSELLVLEGESVDETSSSLKQVTEGVFDESSHLVDPEAAGTYEVANMISIGVENDSDVLSLDKESATSSLVLKRKSVELTDSTLKQVHQERSNKSTLFTELPPLQVNPDDEFIEESSLGKNDSEMIVLEEKSVKDIDSTLKQATEGYLDRSFTLQDDSNQNQTRSELEQKGSELLIPEPKTVTDGDVDVKQVTEENSKKAASSSPEESSDGINQEVEGPSGATAAVKTSERQQDAEVEYVKETIVTFDEAVNGENSSRKDQINKRTDGEDISSEGPISSTPPILKIRKKKSEKSDSSSSSSSSSSDSE